MVQRDINKLQLRTPKETDKLPFSNQGQDFYTTIYSFLSLIGAASIVIGYDTYSASASTTINFTKNGVPFSFPSTNYAFLMNDNGGGVTELSRTGSSITLQIPSDNTIINYIAIL